MQIFDFSRPAAKKSTLGVMTLVAVLLLIIGTINFINLETAQAIRRAKEVGIRKTLGVSRPMLVRQFLLQSFMVTSISVILSIPLAELAFNIYSDFIPQGVEMSLAESAPFILGTIIIIGLLAGVYPAFVLSSSSPGLVLKNQLFPIAAAPLL